MTPTKPPRLSAKEFTKLVAAARENKQRGRFFSEEAITLARLVLVDGKGYADAVREIGLDNRNVAYQAVQRLMRHHDPEGVVSFTYTGPAEMFAQFDKIAAKYNATKK